jgi:hypothetical protein
VLVDEDDRRYFKQREIYLWRKQDKVKTTHKLKGHEFQSNLEKPSAPAGTTAVSNTTTE